MNPHIRFPHLALIAVLLCPTAAFSQQPPPRQNPPPARDIGVSDPGVRAGAEEAVRAGIRHVLDVGVQETSGPYRKARHPAEGSCPMTNRHINRATYRARIVLRGRLELLWRFKPRVFFRRQWDPDGKWISLRRHLAKRALRLFEDVGTLDISRNFGWPTGNGG